MKVESKWIATHASGKEVIVEVGPDHGDNFLVEWRPFGSKTRAELEAEIENLKKLLTFLKTQ